jgi:hypothetical protein
VTTPMRLASLSVISMLLFTTLISCGKRSERKEDSDAPASTARPSDAQVAKPWRLVGSQGSTQFVYVEAEKAGDRVLMAQILQVVVGQKSKVTRPVEVMFFDKESETPLAFPMTDSQMLHQVAQYNYNPNNGFEEFVWLTITDSKASPPKRSTQNDSVSPGIAR